MAAKNKTVEKKWFATGEEGVKKSKAEDEASRERRAKAQAGGRRWRLKSEEEGKLTFLDKPEFFFREHNLEIGGKYGNFFTCLSDFDTCPLDDIDNPSYVVACTIIDHREWTDNSGNKHKNEKKLLVCKGAAKEEVLRQASKRDLRFCLYEVARGSKPTECNTGEKFEFVKKLDEKTLMKIAPAGATKDWLKPFNYLELFAPKSPEELRKLAGQAEPVGGEGEASEGIDADASGDGTGDDIDGLLL